MTILEIDYSYIKAYQSHTRHRTVNQLSKMKLLVVLAVAVACASADVSHVNSDFEAPIVKSTYELSPEGKFNYAYETGNGIVAEATGNVKAGEYPTSEVKGFYKYTSPEGEVVEQVYTADENGYVPQGSHLPVPPPTPEAILRALKYIADHPPPVEKP